MSVWSPFICGECRIFKVQTVPKNTKKSTSWATAVWINWTKCRKCKAEDAHDHLSMPMMCFSSYSLQTKGDQPTWFRQHIHYSDKIQDPILLLKLPFHVWDKTNHQTCCYTVPLDCITVQASYPRLLCTLMVLYRIIH